MFFFSKGIQNDEELEDPEETKDILDRELKVTIKLYMRNKRI